MTGAALRMTWRLFFLFSWQAQYTLDTWTGKIAKRIGNEAVSSALTFPFLKKSRRIASFFDVANFKK